MNRAKRALIRSREALYNVPPVGEFYDQQHADTHMTAVLEIQDLLTDDDYWEQRTFR